jgi:Cof subfamily protein (haloacid dehalogenase superfamily)
MNHARKAVFLDIDGTLIPSGRSTVSAEDIVQITLAHNAGHLIFLNTARSLANIPAELIRAPWLDGIVAAAGAHILMAGASSGFTTIRSKRIPLPLLSAICEIYIRLGKWCLFEGETELYALNYTGGVVAIKEPLAVTHQDDFPAKYPDARVSKLTMEGEIIPEEQELLGDMLRLFPQYRYHEGIIKGESKAKGMERTLEASGISREQSIAIGDSLNDLDMIRYAGLGIAMGNACTELKNAAGCITATVTDNGVAQALRRVCL